MEPHNLSLVTRWEVCQYALYQSMHVRLIPRLHGTTGCQTGLTTGLTTGCIV